MEIKAPKEIMKEDINYLLQKLEEYKETAEQYMFVSLLMIDNLLEKTNIDEILKNQKECRSMYRTIAKAIGLDYSMYEEV